MKPIKPRKFVKKVEKKEVEKEEVHWTVKYMEDMGKADVIPEDWVKAAIYQIDAASAKDITDIKILRWKPTHVDEEARLIDEADFWASCLIDNTPYGILCSIKKEALVEYIPGEPSSTPPWMK